jgi:hypothetical protein
MSPAMAEEVKLLFFHHAQIVENTVKSVEKNKYTSSSENGSGFLPIIVNTEFTSATKVTIVRIMVSFETFFILLYPPNLECGDLLPAGAVLEVQPFVVGCCTVLAFSQAV